MATTPTTTSGILPSLLDLLAPAQARAGGNSGTAFDALLQPPARPAERDAEHRWDAGEEHDAPRAQSPPPPRQPARDDAIGQSHEQSREETAELDFKASDAAPDAANAVEEEATHETEPTAEAALLAESLAGSPLCVLSVPPETAPAIAETPKEAIERSASRRTNRKGEATGVPAKETGAALVSPNGEVIGAAKQAESSTNPATNAHPDLHHAQQPDGASAEPHDRATARPDAAGDGAVTDIATIPPVEPIAELTPEPAERASSREEIALAAASSDQPVQASSANNVPVSPSETPVVAAAATPLAAQASDGAGGASAASNASGVPATGPTRRPRLPAEMLAQDVGRSGRNQEAPLDAVRLLTRVARAFAAAQQRDGEIQLRLSPPELGSLKLTLQMQDGGLVARLETETSSAKTAIIENLPALRERLAEQGVRIERFDVDLMQREPGGMPDGPGDQQRESPRQRTEPAVRPPGETALPVRVGAAAVGSVSGLNVIV